MIREGRYQVALAERLGARYLTGQLSTSGLRPDIVIECTGGLVVIATLEITGPVAIVCLAGLTKGQCKVQIDSEILGRTMVLENDVIFGTVNANRGHYAMGPTRWPQRIRNGCGP